MSDMIQLSSGQVSFPIRLLELPGSGGIGLDLVYGYSRPTATLPNVLAPASICGLGWDLVRQRIITDPGLSTSRSGLRFALVDSSGGQELLRDRDLSSAGEDRISFRMPSSPTAKVVLDRRTSSWEIQNGDGTVFVYGDENLPGTVEYDLGFSNWFGPANNPAREGRLPIAWNLAKIRLPFGQEYVFHYESDEAGVTEAAGENRTYTRATYLTRVIGAGGDELELSYGNRELFEYTPYHGPRANLYRDRFESRYLTGAQLISPASGVLSTVQLIYEENGATVYLGSDDAHRKRLLMGIRRGQAAVVTEKGDAADFTYAPDSLFDYWGRVPGDGVDPGHVQAGPALYGALKTVTGLTGAVQSFDYTTMDGGASAREIALDLDGSERAYFAEDYAVLTSYDGTKATVQPVVRSGRWIACTPLSRNMSQSDYTNARVALADENFAVLAAGQLFLFARDSLRPDVWITTTESVAANSIGPVAGDGFVAIVEDGVMRRFTFRAAGASQPPVWVATDAPGAKSARTAAVADVVAIDGRDNFLLTAGYNNGDGALTVELDFLENNGQWNADAELKTLRTTTATIAPVRAAAGLVVETGEGFAVITLEYPASMGTTDAKYLMCRWDADFRNIDLRELTDRSRSVEQQTRQFSSGAYQLAAVRGGLMGIDQSLFRVFGDKLPVSSELEIPPAKNGVYAPDLFLFETPGTGGKSTYGVLEFDPGAKTFKETVNVSATAGLPLAAAAQSEDAAEADYMLTGGVVYYRDWNATPGATGLWQPVGGVAPPASATNIHFGQGFLVYQEASKVKLYALQQAQAVEALAVGGTLLNAGPRACAVSAGGTVTLYWYEDGKATGLVTTYPTGTIKSYDGERTVATQYEYADAQGSISKGAIVREGLPVYNRVIRKTGGVLGAGDPEFLDGRVEHYFYTGPDDDRSGTAENYAPYPDEHQGSDQYPYNSEKAAGVVTGLAYLAKTYDAQDVELSVNTPEYLTYVVPVGLLGSGRYAAAGSFVRVSRTTATHQKITNYLDYVYDADGRLKTERSRNINQDGNEQVGETEYSYFNEYDTYRGLAVRSNLSRVVVARTRRVTTFGGLQTEVTYPVTEVTTLRDWSPELSSAEAWAPFKSYRWVKDPKQAGDTGAVVAYDAANPDTFDPPAGWELLETVVERGPTGGAVVGRDQGGVFYSSLYDEVTGEIPVAGFSGARIDRDQCSYCGFEIYEPSNFNGWVGPGGLPLKAGIRSDDSVIGERSYYMEAGVPGPRRVMRPNFDGDPEPRAFVFSCFIKSETGYDGGGQWNIEAYHDDRKIDVPGLNLAIPATGQRWTYIQKIIDPGQIRAAGSLAANARLDYVLQADNASGKGAVRLDQLRFSPVDGSFSGMAYEFDRRRMTAGTGTNGEIQRNLQRAADFTGALVTNNDGSSPGERVATMSGASLSRLVSGQATPDADLPDHGLEVGAGSQSAYVDFRNARSSDWIFTGTWNFQNGTLACTAAGNAVFQDFAVAAFALRLRIAQRSGSVSVTTDAAGGFVLTRDDSGWKLDPGGGGSALTAPANGPSGNEDLLFVRVDGLLALYANGQQIFAIKADGGQSAGPARIELKAGAGSAFADFTLTAAPPANFSFQDGGGRPVQSLAVLDVTEFGGAIGSAVPVAVDGALYDELGRGYVQRRPVTTRLDFNGATHRLVAGPDRYLAAPDGDQVDLATYLAGTTENGTAIIDYGRTYFERSPFSRPKKTENPRALAEDAGLYTTHYEPSSDATCDVFDDLVDPAPDGKGRYGVGREYDGTGLDGYGLADQWGRALFQRVVMGDGYLTTGMIYDDAGNLIEKRPPNYYLLPTGSKKADWIVQYDYDLLRGLLLSEKSRDRGTTRFIYDTACRLRFRQDAQDEAAGQVVYTKYDRVGRRIEIGTVPWTGTWSELQAQADDPTWPSSGNTYQKQFLYDYDADNPDALYLLGRLRSTAVNNGAEPDVETCTYDALGKTIRHVLSVPDFDDGAPQTTDYQRDQTGRVRVVTYPPASRGGTGLEVGYYYDRSGRLTSIGDANASGVDRQRYAAYGYDRMGRIVSEALNGAAEAGAQITRTTGFNPAGLPVALDDQYWRETLDYDKAPKIGDPEQFNGRINSTAFEYKPERWSCPPSNYAYEYDYDDKRRLTRARHTTEESNSLVFAADEINLTGGFDANGNFLTYRRGLSRRTYAYLDPQQDPQTAQPYNRVYGVDATTDVRFDPALAEGRRAGDFVWGSSNGGPSGTTVSAPEIAVAGAAPGRYEFLRLESYLEQRATYQLSYDIKVDADFAATSAGQCGWFVCGKTAAGEIFEQQLQDASAAGTAFTTETLTVDLAALADRTTSDELLGDVRIEFRNGRWERDGGPAGPVYLKNVSLATLPDGGEPGDSFPIGAYGYYANGTTETAPELSLAYDPVIHRPTTIERTRGGESAQIAFRYGARNQRLRKQASRNAASASRWYLHGGRARPLVRLDRDDAAGDPENAPGDGVSYIYGPRGLIAIRGAGGLHFALKDHLGSTRVLVNEAGAVDRYYDYLPYGGLMRTGGAAPADNEQRYTGQEKDGETGLYNYRARLYDPDLRRFYSPDPARQTDSPYSYVDGNPVSRTDPSGRSFTEVAAWILNPPANALRIEGFDEAPLFGAGTPFWVIMGLRTTYFVFVTAGGMGLAKFEMHDAGLKYRYYFKSAIRFLDPNRYVLDMLDPVELKEMPQGEFRRVSDRKFRPRPKDLYPPNLMHDLLRFFGRFEHAAEVQNGGRLPPRYWTTNRDLSFWGMAFFSIGVKPTKLALSTMTGLGHPAQVQGWIGSSASLVTSHAIGMGTAGLMWAGHHFAPDYFRWMNRRTIGGRAMITLFPILNGWASTLVGMAIENEIFESLGGVTLRDTGGNVLGYQYTEETDWWHYFLPSMLIAVALGLMFGYQWLLSTGRYNPGNHVGWIREIEDGDDDSDSEAEDEGDEEANAGL